MFDVMALGELLIDFHQKEVKSDSMMFEANPGGAPCNVLAMLARTGHATAFIGCVGNDVYGRFLRDKLKELEIGTGYLKLLDDAPTTLAVVSNTPDGDRDFRFYRKGCADLELSPEDLPEGWTEQTKVFHFGTLSLTGEPAAATTREAVRQAKEAGVTVSCDPNLRMPLWDDENRAKEAFRFCFEQADVMKISDYEVQWFTGEEDYVAGAKMLFERYPMRLLLVSAGEHGSYAFSAEAEVFEPARKVHAVDTTGAGDCFMGACLADLCASGTADYSEARLQTMLRYANAAASIVVQRYGALMQMPAKAEVEEVMKSA